MATYSITHHDTLNLNEKLQAQFSSQKNEDGSGNVIISLVLKLPDGEVARFMTDVERMEHVAKRMEAYQRGTERDLKVEQVGEYQATFDRLASTERDAVPWVHLRQDDTAHSGRVQESAIQAEHLKAVVEKGLAVERELKCERIHYPIIYEQTLKALGPERVEAQVVRSVEGLGQAQTFMKDHVGWALVTVPQRRELARDTLIELGRLDEVEVKGGKLATVEDRLGHINSDGERRGERYVLALWNDIGHPPTPGTKVFWEGAGNESGREFAEFRSRPIARGEQGEPNPPVYVLIKKSVSVDGAIARPFNGEIVAASHVKDDMVKLLGRLETEDRQQHQREQGQHHAATARASELSVGMEKHRNTFKP